jgi:hypothetical protein
VSLGLTGLRALRPGDAGPFVPLRPGGVRRPNRRA